jgi:hypothetical protein
MHEPENPHRPQEQGESSNYDSDGGEQFEAAVTEVFCALTIDSITSRALSE